MTGILPLDHLVLQGNPTGVALVLRDVVLNYETFDRRVGQLSSWLLQNVPQRGSVVASWAAKGELTALLPLAAARAGLVHVPINPLMKRPQVAHILSDSESSLLIATPSRLALLEASDIPPACTVVAEPDAISASIKCDAAPPGAADVNDLVAILYTSGSTGKPKGVMLSHANLWLGAQSVAGYLGLQPGDRTLAVLPLSFDYGQNQLLSTWYAGGCVVPLDYLVPKDVIKAVQRYKITTLAGVPPLWVQLVEREWPEEAAASLRRLTNSGGALTVRLVSQLRSLFPKADLYAMYGLTEAFRSTCLDPALIDSHPTSIGSAIPHAEILVVNDKGEPVADGEEGELVHCGPLVAGGYWHDEVRTAERFRPAPTASHYGGTAVWSGDRVIRDANGLLTFVGRRDTMIKSAGNRISPQEIEDAAVASGVVYEAVAIGVPDERLGQAIELVVRAAAGAEPEGLTTYLAKNLPNFMQPRHIYWRDSMPIGPNGKIDREALSAEIMS